MKAIVCSSSSTLSAGSSPARILQKMQSSSGTAGYPIAPAMGLLNRDELRERVERLAAIERGRRSAGEARGGRADRRGAARGGGGRGGGVHGTYWWPVGTAHGARPAGSPRRRLAGLFGGDRRCVDDITGGSQWFRRTFLPKRTTTNVVRGDRRRTPSDTVVVVAHHDAAHSGLVFHPELPRAILRRFPQPGRERRHHPRARCGARWPGRSSGRGASGWQAPRRLALRRLCRRHGGHRPAQGGPGRQRQPHRRRGAALAGARAATNPPERG